MKNSGTAFAASGFNKYQYDPRQELSESARYLGTDLNNVSSPVTSEYRSYIYDPIGNRKTITQAANNGTYNANNLNQYTGASLPGGGSNSYSHDFDGNLTQISGSKNVQYVYDAENRMISARPSSPVVNDKKLDLLYDYQGRRIQKITSSYNGSSWVVESTKRFVYDGWNMVEEQTVSPAATQYYVWGLDLSQSLQGAGGIGGLLATVSGTTTRQFLYDGNGNVGQMINATGGAIDAHYEYDPYGNTLLATGTQATSNPYRFSTKYLDSAYNLYYYGFRYYDPETGRWVSRDPIGENGGFLLYGFVYNNPTFYIDDLGHFPIPTEEISDVVRAAEEILRSAAAADASIPDPSDAVWQKWIAYGTGAAALGVTAYLLNQDHRDNKLYAFGNKLGPRAPRWDRDLHLHSEDDIVISSPELGASVFGDVNLAPLTGHYHQIPQNTPMPDGLDIIPDGIDVGGKQPATHHTIFVTRCMPYKEFVAKFYLLPWVYGGKK